MAASAARKETENIRWELGKALIELKDEWDLLPQREGRVRGEGYHFTPIFKSLQELLISCYMKSIFPSQRSRHLASWAAFNTRHSPSHTCAPAKLSCTALPQQDLSSRSPWELEYQLLGLPACPNLLLFKTLLQVSSEALLFSPTDSSFLLCVSEPCKYFPPGTCYFFLSCTLHTSEQFAGKILASFLQLTGLTVPFLAQGAQLQEQINDTQICGQTALRVTLCMISLWSMKMVALVTWRLVLETDYLGSNPSSTIYYLYYHDEQVVSSPYASVSLSIKRGNNIPT